MRKTVFTKCLSLIDKRKLSSTFGRFENNAISTDDSELEFAASTYRTNACGEPKTNRYHRPKNKKDKLSERDIVATRHSKRLADIIANQKQINQVAADY